MVNPRGYPPVVHQVRSHIRGRTAPSPSTIGRQVASRRGAAEDPRQRHWLWRAVDQHGVVLDILVQERRDQASAERFLQCVLHSCEYEPRVVITDKLASYAPAIRRVLPRTEHRRHKRLNNRAENSHLPTRKRERVLQRFKSAEHAQRFLGPFSAVCNHFRPRRHRLTASAYRDIRTERHAVRRDVTLAGVRHKARRSDRFLALRHTSRNSQRLT